MTSSPTENKLFVRNESGRGFRPTARGQRLLRVWEVASWALIATIIGVYLIQGSVPWWLLVVGLPFAIAPLIMMMLFTGLGPIGALIHYGRRIGGKP